jgi:predicted RNA-binding Zn-ribbon protein involved in translation (DUF1610 family)
VDLSPESALPGTGAVGVTVRLRTDGNGPTRDNARVSSDPYADSEECAACGGRLVAMSSSLPESVEGGPHFKCAECGQSYVSRGSADPLPLGYD